MFIVMPVMIVGDACVAHCDAGYDSWDACVAHCHACSDHCDACSDHCDAGCDHYDAHSASNYSI